MKKILLVTTVLALGLQMSCRSRNFEKDPEGSGLSTSSLQARINQKAMLDQKLSQINKVADRLKNIYETVKKIQQATDGSQAYTPVDFVLDINSELNDKVPKQSGNAFYRDGKVRLPISALDEAHQTVKIRLTSSNDLIGGREGARFEVKGAATDEKYLEVFSSYWTENLLTLSFNNDVLSTLFSGYGHGEELKASNCNIETKGNEVASVTCQDLLFQLSASEVGEILELTYSAEGEADFFAKVKIKQNNILKRKITITGYKDKKRGLVIADGEF